MSVETNIILAVDDNRENLFILEQLICEQLTDCKVLTASNADEGMKLLETHGVDGALIDVQMPGVDGIEMCRRIKKVERFSHIPLLLITSHKATTDLRVRGLEAGADDFISRPIDNLELIAKIRVLLRIKHVEDQLRLVNERLEDMVDAKVGELREAEKKSRTLKKEAEETRLQMAMIVESTRDAVYGLDLEGSIFTWNKGAEAIYGHSADEIVGGSISRLVPETHLHEMERYLEEAALGGILANQEIKHLKSDGAEFDVSLTISTIKDPEGKVIGVSTIARDITLRKKAEKALVESEQRYSSLFEDNHAVMILFDPEKMVVVDANPAACLYYGYDKSELVGKSSEEISSLPHEEMMRNFKRASSGGRQPMQSRHRLAGGEIRDVEMYSTPIKVRDRTFLFSIIHDITERKQAEEAKAQLENQLRRAQKMEAIGTLAGGIAHDFNNILSVILGFAEILREDLRGDTVSTANIDEILSATNRATNLVKQILTFSRQTKQENKPVHLHLIVKETLQFLRASLPTTIEIRQNIDPECGAVLADPTQMHQILMNLCTNAFHAMSETGGVLTIGLERLDVTAELKTEHSGLDQKAYIHLVVSDTGHGMSKEVLDRIFDPFFTTKGPGEGTGMGLSTVHGIVLNHHGHIHVASKPGKGTTFHIYLPRFGSVEQPEAPSEAPLAKGKERVLFVDDEEALVRLGEQMLKRLGYQITTAASSLEALGIFRENPHEFDLVITDLTMPHLTGVGLAREIHNIRPNIPIILCTGFSEKITEANAKKMGFHHFVMKPIVRRNLADAIRQALQENPSFASS